jgi:hypothetical protein
MIELLIFDTASLRDLVINYKSQIKKFSYTS